MVYLLILSSLFDGFSKPKLIYVGDPMCSWCYGISEELAELKSHYQELDFQLVLGGLRPYNTETMTDLKDFLSHHWEDVHKMSGQEFNYGILDRADLIYDTEPPSRACLVVRSLAKEKEFDFFKAIQRMFYYDNVDLSQAENYHPLLKEMQIDSEEFDTRFHSDEFKERIKQDFQKSADMGVRGFPTLILEHQGQLHLIASGFATAEQMKASIKAILP